MSSLEGPIFPPMPREYAVACGPQALARAADLTPVRAASILWMVAYGLDRAPLRPGKSTNVYDIGRVLIRLGHPVEEWTSARPGWLVTDTEAYIEVLNSLLHDRPWSKHDDPETRRRVRAAAEAEGAKLGRTTVPMSWKRHPPSQRHTVGSWRRAFPEGVWILSTLPEKPPADGFFGCDHVLCVRAGETDAANRRYEDRIVYDVLGVPPPEEGGYTGRLERRGSARAATGTHTRSPLSASPRI